MRATVTYLAIKKIATVSLVRQNQLITINLQMSMTLFIASRNRLKRVGTRIYVVRGRVYDHTESRALVTRVGA